MILEAWGTAQEVPQPAQLVLTGGTVAHWNGSVRHQRRLAAAWPQMPEAVLSVELGLAAAGLVGLFAQEDAGKHRYHHQMKRHLPSLGNQ